MKVFFEGQLMMMTITMGNFNNNNFDVETDMSLFSAHVFLSLLFSFTLFLITLNARKKKT